MIAWQPKPARRYLSFGLVLAAGLSALGVSTVLDPRPWLVYNPSPSVAVGFYWIAAPDGAKTGDLVLAELPSAMRKLAARRRYLPVTVPVLKTVAAAAGDEVCAAAETIRINGQSVGTRRRSDHFGRAMPWWEGCHRLQADEVFFFNAASPASFDGRYFGVVKRVAIIGKARPV